MCCQQEVERCICPHCVFVAAGDDKVSPEGLVPHRPFWSDLQKHHAGREARKGKKMGANSTQGSGVAVFLTGFTLLAAGIANSMMLLDLVGAVVVLASLALFRKAKPWEEAE
jgi:hypothetical protein